ncbi:DUF1254 domain-containing protein [Streptomyces sp. NPDC050418]|uniref:DUF1254 domain-containing protein n=1 Tax=Streptomyces sp. NPDC050418 TaxID=3365612 RepID=UPI0037980BFD
MDFPSGPLAGTKTSDAYLTALGRVAYLWGWPLVNMHNRLSVMEQLPAPGLLAGTVPAGPPGTLGMLCDYVRPEQRIVASPNQDTVYGFGLLDAERGPSVLQVPDLGDRFWVIQLVNQRTDSFARLGSPYGTRPGHYLVAPVSWDGEVPAGIVEVVRYDTRTGAVVPRLFMDDTDADRAAVLPVVEQLGMYPLAEYDGTVKRTDWSAVPSFGEADTTSGETPWVDPDRFFDQLSTVMDEVPPLPGEEALYAWFRSLLTTAASHPAAAKTLRQAARDADTDLVTDLFQYRNIGLPSAHHWTTQRNGASFGTDYLSRTAMGKANIFVNPPEETAYYYLDLDADGTRLNGAHAYTVTFAADAIPPVKGFWSLTLYDEHHFFHPNELDRFSLGTKNKDLHTEPDGSLVLAVGGPRPTDAARAANWLPAPDGDFCLYLRAYWPEAEILDQRWTPPPAVRVGPA